MLTSETRKHIDSARQVLVGKVPDPKSQVNEITNALIYKFMDDMDEMTASVGGKRRYFVGDYEKYSWRKIMDPKVGAHERINLYTEALARLSKNENLPELFRNIFSRAYLPFNDGRTLSLFLQEIDYFDYKNSESLGDAYEYLLSIMGSQGDAGQFRTPRHIIDFIVDVVDPDKNDSVLDPACGTAGFLISAYKHVMAKYDGKDDITGTPSKSEKKLSADERKKLHDNYFGFDIDDNMVKMAQVNMYLHGFLDPDISVHDTLSSEDYWHDKYDVILANPPFMSPKGGVMPHNKFGVESTRAEVLFVDYITTHLKPHGRAGIIVPEGIIFQSGTAYKQLRKNLVNDGLYAVVSLPSGVFNPYAGVKTSILLFDNELSKKTQDILFVKVENDGFDLGAQRREILQNDLPQAVQEIKAYQQYVITRKSTSAFTERIEKENNSDTLVIHHDKYILVKKTHIAENGDYNLSGERYRVATDYTNAKWPMVKLGEILERVTDQINPLDEAGEVFYVGLENIESNTGQLVGNPETKYKNIKSLKYRFKKRDLLFGKLRPNLNKVWLASCEGICSTDIIVFRGGTGIVTELYWYLMRSTTFVDTVLSGIKGAQLPRVGPQYVQAIPVPLPPLEIQEQIVAELDSYQNIINGAKRIADNWKPKLDIDSEWEKVRLGEVADFTMGGTPPQSEINSQNANIPWVKGSNLSKGYIYKTENFISDAGMKSSRARYYEVGTILVGRTGQGRTRGTVSMLKIKATTNETMIGIFPNSDKVNSEYLYNYLISQYQKFREIGGDDQRGGITQRDLDQFIIVLPSIEIQKQIVENIEAERALVESAKKLIEIYEEKTKNVIAKLWEQQ